MHLRGQALRSFWKNMVLEVFSWEDSWQIYVWRRVFILPATLRGWVNLLTCVFYFACSMYRCYSFCIHSPICSLRFTLSPMDAQQRVMRCVYSCINNTITLLFWVCTSTDLFAKFFVWYTPTTNHTCRYCHTGAFCCNNWNLPNIQYHCYLLSSHNNCTRFGFRKNIIRFTTENGSE